MFDKEKPLNEAQLRDIRSMGNTQAGGHLSQYIEQEVQGYINGMLRANVDDVSQIAYAQAGAEIGKKIWSLLNADMSQILDEHNIEPEEDYEAG